MPGTSTFPAVVDVLTTTHVDNTEHIESADINNMAASIEAVENEVRTGASCFNVRHFGSAPGTVGIGSDDSVAINAAASAANTWANINGHGHAVVMFPPGNYQAINIVIYPNVTYDGFGGSLVQLPNGAANGSNVFLTVNFSTLTGTNAYLPSAGVPYHFGLLELRISGNRANNPNGGSGVVIFGYGFLIRDCHIFDCHGMDLWTEYGGAGEPFQTTGTNLLGDAGARFERLELGPCDQALAAPSPANDWTRMGGVITGVTNSVNPTFTTTRNHSLNAGQTIVMSTFAAPLTALNGTWTVLAVPSGNTFTITSGAPGVWTSGGVVQSAVYPQWAHMGPHDSWSDGVLCYSDNNAIKGSRGVLCGNNGAGGTATGMSFQNLHIYNRFDVGLDAMCGNVLMGQTCQVEGASRVNILLRANGFNTINGVCYAGRNPGASVGNVATTGLQLENNSNGNVIDLNMKDIPQQGDSGGTYLVVTTTYNRVKALISHGVSGSATLGGGTLGANNYMNVRATIYDGGSGIATITPGWVPPAGGVSTTDFGLFSPGTAVQVMGGITIYSCVGVPSNSMGSNGDVCFRSDGTTAAHTFCYHKEAGSWVQSSA